MKRTKVKYRVERLDMLEDESLKLDDKKMNFLLSMCWVTKMDMMRNEHLSRRIGVREEVSDNKWIERIRSCLEKWSV